MNSRQRVQAALEKQPVDRVPVWMLFHPETAQKLAGLLDIPAARLSDALGDKAYLLGDFSIADIAMATVLREGVEARLIAEYPRLAAYLDRCTGRPAFQRAMDAQLASFKEKPVTA